MADDANQTTKPIAQSLTLQGALAMGLAFVAGKAGLALPEGQAAPLVQAVTDLMFYAGSMAVGVGRARARATLS